MNAFQYYVIDSYIKNPNPVHSHTSHTLLDEGGEDGPLVFEEEYESESE